MYIGSFIVDIDDDDDIAGDCYSRGCVVGQRSFYTKNNNPITRYRNIHSFFGDDRQSGKGPLECILKVKNNKQPFSLSLC